MRQYVVGQTRVRARLCAIALALALALVGCSFDTAASAPARDERPVVERNEADAAAIQDAGDGEPVRDARVPPPPELPDAEPHSPVRPDDPPTDASSPPDAADAAIEAGMDAAVDADVGDDEDAAVPEPDASDPCADASTSDCMCPHEALEANDACGPALCPIDECAPDDHCRFVSGAGSGYYFCDDQRSWQQAENRCDTISGAHLATIESADEDQLVFEQIADKTWIGGSDAEQEGRWRWESGAAFYDDEDGVLGGAFVNWGDSEPNDVGLSESAPDCLMYWYQESAWADASCGDAHGYICEID